MKRQNRLKIITLYYTHNGITGLLAEAIREEVGGDLLKIELSEVGNAESSMIYAWQNEMIFVTENSLIRQDKIQLDDYDLIFIGTPVWAAQISPQIEALINSVDFTNKKIAVFITHEGLKGSIEDKFREKLVNSKIVGIKDFLISSNVDRKLIAFRLKEWSREIIEKMY